MTSRISFLLRPTVRASLLTAAAAALLTACGGNDDIRFPGEPHKVIADLQLSASTVARIDDYVNAQLQRQHIPGMAVVVTWNGQVVFKKGYGTADLASGTTVTPDTAFRIASLTKQFTASAIMLLVQDGKLQLDQKLTDFLPTAPASWKDITIRHLLTHTSGLQRDFPSSLLGRIDPARLPSIDQLVAMAGDAPLAYPTGSAHAYSNVGYHLLGFVIEKATGLHYAGFLQERVFRPLGMNSAETLFHTRYGSRATGYTWDGSAVKLASTVTMIPGLLEAEGGLQMSAADLAKWDMALNENRILTTASRNQMWTPARLNDGSTVPYGFGWALDEINQRPFVQHDGLVEGFTSQYARHANESLSVIVLANSDRAQTQRVVSRIRAMLEPGLDWMTTTDPRPATGALLRAVMDESARGTLRPDHRFAASFQEMMTPEVLQSFTDYLAPWGTIEQFGYIDQARFQGMPVARYLVRSKYEQAVIGIALDEQGRIAYMGLLAE